MAKILSVPARAGMAHLVEPVSRALLRVGISPNAVTVAGTLGVLAGAIGFGARGHFVTATIFVTVAALTDLVDGTMARIRGTSSRFGALLDSSMDRVSDAAVFGVVAFYFARHDDWVTAVLALVCLVASMLVSYVKARAEGLGFSCDVGIVERPERLVLIGIGGLSTAFGVLWGLQTVLWILALLSLITAGQRLAHVYRQDLAAQRAVPARHREPAGYAEPARHAEPAGYAERPEPAGYAERPEPTGYAERPEPAGYAERTEPTGYAERPEPAGYAERTEPIGYGERAEPERRDVP